MTPWTNQCTRTTNWLNFQLNVQSLRHSSCNPMHQLVTSPTPRDTSHLSWKSKYPSLTRNSKHPLCRINRRYWNCSLRRPKVFRKTNRCTSLTARMTTKHPKSGWKSAMIWIPLLMLTHSFKKIKNSSGNRARSWASTLKMAASRSKWCTLVLKKKWLD